jgi:integrase/recombinase XerD
MNGLDVALSQYLAIRRGLGFQLREVAGCLRNFVAFLQAEGSSYVTKELALRWSPRAAPGFDSTAERSPASDQ